MKAVFVIDVPNELDVNDLLIDYCVHTKCEYKTIRKGGNHPIKPLPKPKEANHCADEEFALLDRMYRCGFNACLEDITGETE